LSALPVAPSLVASTSPGPRRIGRILLATDLAPASEGAANEALQLAGDLKAELLIVSVIDGPKGHAFEPQPERMDQRRSKRELAAQSLVIQGRRAGVRVSFLIWEGDPGPSIVEAADAERVDLVVVGTRGRNRVERAVLGSVSDHVIRHAHCPVLVVRA
jgi:nucleotide-binding universal stress UspA family protein